VSAASGGPGVPNYGSLEVITLPNYTTILDFEWNFDNMKSKQWMEENWMTSFYYIGAYMFVIFAGQLYMQTRPKFELRGLLAFWNFMLAGFSILGSYRTLPEIFYILNRKNGFHYSVCFPRLVAPLTIVASLTVMLSIQNHTFLATAYEPIIS